MKTEEPKEKYCTTLSVNMCNIGSGCATCMDNLPPVCSKFENDAYNHF